MAFQAQTMCYLDDVPKMLEATQTRTSLRYDEVTEKEGLPECLVIMEAGLT